MPVQSPVFPRAESHLTQEVENRLKNSPHPPLRRISFEYRDNSLTLCGILPSFYHKQLAQEAVSDLAGTCQIDNQITVSYPA